MLGLRQRRWGLVVSILISATEAVAAPEGLSMTEAPPRSRQYELGVKTSYRSIGGRFDPYGDYAANPDGSRVWSLTTKFNFVYRIDRQWQVGASVSARNSQSNYPSGTLSTRSFGNPSLDGRYHLFTTFAHFGFHAGVSLPLKVSHSISNGEPGRDLSDDMGSDLGSGSGGGFSVNTGMNIAHSFKPLKLRAALDLSVTQPFPKRKALDDAQPGAPEALIRKGRQYQLGEGVTYSPSDQWSFNGGFRQMWAGNSSTGETEDPGTAARLFSSSIGASYSPRAEWKVSAAYDTPYPFYHFLANQPYAPTIGVGLVYTGI